MKPVLRLLMGVIVLPTQDEIDTLIATIAAQEA